MDKVENRYGNGTRAGTIILFHDMEGSAKTSPAYVETSNNCVIIVLHLVCVRNVQ